jgi:lipopolysaccharide/colanic/teichoic acid biosynthesis glycosyltransferase
MPGLSSSAFLENRHRGEVIKMGVVSIGSNFESSRHASTNTVHPVSQPPSPLRLPTGNLRYRIIKPALDRVTAAAIIPVVSILGLVIAALIKISSPGPVFFRHRRVGVGGREFMLWKFRTMTHGSIESLQSHLAADSEAHREWSRHQKLRRDPRVTRVGQFLRKTNLDELPQLLNVIAGEMSLVGPRPVVEEELKRYGAGGSLYAAAKPGMTGLWQVSGRGSLPYEQRVALDIEYVATWSLSGDIKVLLRTFGAICSARGAY